MTDAWLNQFEIQLEQLECAAQDDAVPFAQLVSSATSALEIMAERASLRMWLFRPQQLERFADDGTRQPIPNDSEPEVAVVVERGHLLTGSERGCTLFTATSLADQFWFVLAVDHSVRKASDDTFVQGTLAIAQMVGSRISRRLLTHFERRLRNHAQLLTVTTRLQDSQSVQQAANIIAQDAGVLLNSDRTSVLMRRSDRFELQAITGVTNAKAEADTVQALRVLAAEESALRTWCRTDSDNDRLSDQVRNALNVLHRGGTRQLRLVPLAVVDATSPSDRIVMIIEQLTESPLPDDSMVQQLTDVAAPVFRRQMSPHASWLSGWLTTKRQRWLAGLTLCVAILIFVRTDFEIEVPGRLVAANQQHIFAPEHGTIDEVLFENESAVTAGQILLKMSNPDLELQLRRIQGDIDTTAARLAAARAGRLTSADARFSGDEQQLQKELENLSDQQLLVQQQAETLTVHAGLSGTAFRRDPQQELLARPVQRGQRLLDIVPNNADWQLDLSIPARLLNYITEHRRQSQKPAEVRYLLRSAPHQDWTTQLADVDLAVQIDNGQLVCRATAKPVEVLIDDLRPGTSVIARVYCGRRSVGFVWFREVWEFWRQFQFAWL
ncbi:MAG: hypothetical protein R3C59_21835 [Planctomycetaceae bacterium]